jgi:hypothetical protein
MSIVVPISAMVAFVPISAMVAFKCSTPKVWELLSPRQSLTASRRLPMPDSLSPPLPDAMLARIMEGAKLSWRDRSVQVRPR